MTNKPFTSEMLDTYADRLVRRSLLSHSIGDSTHPVMAAEDVLLKEAERWVSGSAACYRRSPSWQSIRTWFADRVMTLAKQKLSYYRFPPSLGNLVLAEIKRRGFDHLLESRTGGSGVRPSLVSNVMSSDKCKTS